MTESPDFATKPTLEGELAVLRPFTEADLPAMREALLDATVMSVLAAEWPGQGVGG